MNGEADLLATAGAKLHTIDRAIINKAKHRFKLCKVLQLTACKILHERAHTLPLAHRRAGYTEADVAKMREIQESDCPEEVSDPQDDEELMDPFEHVDEFEQLYDQDADVFGHPFDIDNP